MDGTIDRGRWHLGSEQRSSRSRSRGRRSRSRSRDRHHRRRSSRSRSRSRRRSRSRDQWRERERRQRSRDRGRDGRRRSRSRSRSRGQAERRHSTRSRSRSFGRARYRSRSHERGRRDGGRGQPGREASPDRWTHDRFHSTFTSGGRINDDGEGGRPVWGVGGAQPSARMHGYAAALQAGMDADLDAEPYPWEARGGSGAPSSVLRLLGLPEDAGEAELRQLFEPVAGVKDVRVPRERGSALGRGYAFLEFDSPEAAAALMGSDWREQTFYGQHRLRFEYARPRGDATGGAAAAMPGDWVCEFCQGLNYARRTDCYQCFCERTPGARVLGPGDAWAGPAPEEPPSCIVRVGAVPPGADEEALRFLFVPHAPVKDVRLVRDRYTGEPRGVAYIQFYSVEDATKALHACQDARLEGQAAPLQLTFARDRFADQPHHYYAQQYHGHMATEAAAEAALAHAGWAPQEFGGAGEGEGGDGGAGGEEDDDPLAAWERQQAAEAAAEAGGAPDGQALGQPGIGTEQPVEGGEPAGAAQQAGQAQQQPAVAAEQEEGEVGYDPLAAAAELQPEAQQAQQAAALAEQRAAVEAAGFQYDSASGYLRDPVSGYYYDANTGLYCHPTLNQWGTYDYASGQFVPHDAAAAEAAAAAAAAPGFSSAADSALAYGSAHLYGTRQPAAAAAQHALYDQGFNGAAGHGAAGATQRGEQQPAGQQRQRPKRGAVIGASAQLDPQGLMVAARAAEEKVQLLRKQAEMEEAKRKAKEKRLAAKQAAIAGAAATLPAAQTAQQGSGAAAPGGSAPPAGAGGVVVGRIYQGSWAARQQQQQQQR